MDERNFNSLRILTASSGLSGLCFIILTSLKALNLSGKTYVAEFRLGYH